MWISVEWLRDQVKLESETNSTLLKEDSGINILLHSLIKKSIVDQWYKELQFPLDLYYIQSFITLTRLNNIVS